MPRPRLTDRPKQFNVQLPESLYAKLRVELYSELEGRVPHGALSELVQSLVRNWLIERGEG